MTSSLTIAQFRSQFGTTPDRLRLLSEFEGFLTQLRSNFTQYRVLVYGSFISQKQVPRDIDVIVSVSSSPTDPGFNKFSKLQALATQCVDRGLQHTRSAYRQSYSLQSGHRDCLNAVNKILVCALCAQPLSLRCLPPLAGLARTLCLMEPR